MLVHSLRANRTVTDPSQVVDGASTNGLIVESTSSLLRNRLSVGWAKRGRPIPCLLVSQVIARGERAMIDKFIRGHVKAFTNAVDLGEFTKKPEDLHYAGIYRYMFSGSKSDWFKNKYSQEYSQIPYR